MKILTAAQMREVDRRTSEERSVPSLILMENAGARVFEFLAHKFGPLEKQRVAVICGKGNNGGDGLVVARQLHTRGRVGRLQVVLAGDPDSLQGDAAANYRMLLGADHRPRIVKTETEWEAALGEILDSTIVVDGLLGAGLRGPAEGQYLRIIRDVNARLSHAQVVAVDIPSGLASDSGERLGEAIRADHTITFTAPKVGQVFPPNCEAVGALHVVPIGSAPSLYEDDPEIFLSTIDPAFIAPLFAPRARDAHKGNFGHVLVVAGSTPKPGAAALAGAAALRAGAGLVTVATAARATSAVVAHAPELMTEPLPETELGTVSPAAFDYQRFEKIAANKDVIAIGPGLGTNDETQGFIRKVVRESSQRLVLDADALLQENVRAGAVLTPHPGEMSRLTGMPTAEIQRRRVEVAREFACARGAYVVLKGYRTLVATPDGRVFVNLTGTPAMASGGSGDVLTGMIAGLLAQFPKAPPEQAIAAAVYLHGKAGELASQELGEQCALATDLLRSLSAAIASLRDA
ncbi:MAG: NAD(P)H-hydrate dehydratase [Acidobacteria bacterium]|nr:NAD(P)H-hydrate dehydratase [Acidobacteriota bacterium]